MGMNLIERTAPQRGGFFVWWFQSRTRRKRTPTEEAPPKLISFRGVSSEGVLFLRGFD